MDLKQAREMKKLLAKAGRATRIKRTGPDEYCLREKGKAGQPNYPTKSKQYKWGNKPRSIWLGSCCRAF